MAAADRVERPRVIVVGGGFAGLNVVKALRRCDVDITLVDKRNHHLFQPLLYEVATAALSPGEIAMPLRRIFRDQKNVQVLLDEVMRVDLDARTVELRGGPRSYDYLVLATGSNFSYFGNDQWARLAPGLKTVDDAIEIRRRFLLAFERAEQTDDPGERARLLTTVVVGGGPTGIELAGTMAEVSRKVMSGEFRRLDPASERIVLVEGGPRLLNAFPEECSERARRDLERLGVEVRLDTLVVGIDDDGVALKEGSRIPSDNVVWAAGNQGAAPEQGLDAYLERRDRRLPVGADLSLEGRPEVFAIGDLAFLVPDGDDTPVPALAPAAAQMGRYVGKQIAAEVGGADQGARKPFSYVDKGALATIGRGKAVAVLGGMRFGGFAAWMLWVLVHIFFLIGFRNRLFVMIEWAYAYLTFRRGARLITGVDAGEVIPAGKRGNDESTAA